MFKHFQSTVITVSFLTNDTIKIIHLCLHCIPIFMLNFIFICLPAVYLFFVVREKYVYLMSRGSIAINSNYYCLDHAFWKPTEVQTAR